MLRGNSGVILGLRKNSFRYALCHKTQLVTPGQSFPLQGCCKDQMQRGELCKPELLSKRGRKNVKDQFKKKKTLKKQLAEWIVVIETQVVLCTGTSLFCISWLGLNSIMSSLHLFHQACRSCDPAGKEDQ